ncbi:hypothetical protein BP6252_06306 [Coleophoma cylindrospora]|uniref:Ran-binding-domain-containing protein n=1 Tax=Coleophoma cylindrospora TaxID=1849047 RepID=A0A3D8RMN0_9HELO|nr:hypothetical protein BP6252_06306 [Coleophoma cylindrospora]
MNYAIRSGIGITASFAIRQTSRLLKTVEDGSAYQELHELQKRLNDKIRIISPSIDMIELISARGNTTLESAVTLTKALRWDIQALGLRLSKAAAAEEESRRKKTRAKSRVSHEIEIRLIVQDIKNLLTRIEDAVPLINLAITTSGARLTTALPSTVSPSRLLQASTFLTAGDTQYAMSSSTSTQIGPTFTLTLYMLFAGHLYQKHSHSEDASDMTWKEVIHKARVKLMRVPLKVAHDSVSGTEQSHEADSPDIPLESVEEGPHPQPFLTDEGKSSEFAYHFEIIEDLDDGRVHSFDEGTPQPGPYNGVELAGIRDFLPIHQISKIFYASTGRLLNIGEAETNSPVLLLKRDINALPPRKMMQKEEQGNDWATEIDGDAVPDNLPEGRSSESALPEDVPPDEEEEDPQDDIDEQIRRESSILEPEPDLLEVNEEDPPARAWQLPPDLDPEWLALEVYTEPEESESELEEDANDDSAYVSHRPSSVGPNESETKLSANLENLQLQDPDSPAPDKPLQKKTTPRPARTSFVPNNSPFGNVRSSLSLMEMLIRLTALQQFQQASHLAIPDELLTFFLEESSTTGAGGDSDERRRTRQDARRKVGFDPYDESPVKRRGEEYQYQYQDGAQSPGYHSYSRSGTPYEDYEYQRANRANWAVVHPNHERSSSYQGSPEPWLQRTTSSPQQRTTPEVNPPSPSTPILPYRAPRRKNKSKTKARGEGGGGGALGRVRSERRGAVKAGSPLGRAESVETDSTLGTSPGSPTLVGKAAEKLV